MIPYPRALGNSEVVVTNDTSTHVGQTGVIIDRQYEELHNDWRYAIDFGDGRKLWFRNNEIASVGPNGNLPHHCAFCPKDIVLPGRPVKEPDENCCTCCVGSDGTSPGLGSDVE